MYVSTTHGEWGRDRAQAHRNSYDKSIIYVGSLSDPIGWLQPANWCTFHELQTTRLKENSYKDHLTRLIAQTRFYDQLKK